MDRGGWHHTTCAGLERPRLGQQPYDRGRGISSDRRGCFGCGQDGHIKKFCPQLDSRYCDSGRVMERSAGGGNGRWSHDSWPPARVSSVGREHGYSRTESSREGSSARRPHFDYHETGDFSSQKPRDSVDRHRDNEGRSHGIGAASNANVRERDSKAASNVSVRERDSKAAPNVSVRERDSKSGRSSSRKPPDENHQAVGGHRGEERRENRGKDGELNSEKLSANGDTLGRSPSNHSVSGGDDLRARKAAQEDRLMSSLPGSEADLGRNGSKGGGDKPLRGPSLDGHLAQQITGGLRKEVEGSGSVSGRDRCQTNDSGDDRDLVCTPDQATRNRVPSRRLSGAKLPLSVLCKDAAEGNLERNYRHEEAVFRCASESAAPVEPNPTSSVQKLDTQEVCAEVQGDIKVDCPSHQRDEDGTVKGTNCKADNSPNNECRVESEHTEDKDDGEGRAACEHSEKTEVCGSSGLDESQVKEKRVSRWGVGQEETRARDSDKDEHISVNDSVSDAAEIVEKVLPSGPAEQDPETQLASLGFVDEVHHAPGKETLSLERTRLVHHSEDSASGRLKDRGPLGTRDEPEWNHRDLGLDDALRDCDSGLNVGNNELDQNGVSDGVSQKDSYWQHSESMNSSGLGTPVRERNHSRDRDNYHHSHTGLGSSDYRYSDRNGYTRYGGRTGLKSEYRYHEFGGGYDKVGGRNCLVNNSDFRLGDDGREHRGWGYDWRHSRIWEAHPGQSQYRLDSYVTVCNARYLQLSKLSPMPVSSPLYHGVVHPDPFLSSSHIEDEDSYTMESQSQGWMYHDAQGNLQGPVTFTESQDFQKCEKLRPDCMVQQEGSNDGVTLEHARSPVNCTFLPSPLETREQFVAKPLMPSQAPLQSHAPAAQDHIQEEHYVLENADQDICPPGTEACGAGIDDEDYEDYHIDERVEKLMDGRILISGKEKESIHEALSIASRRVMQEYESDIAVEESPRSHGGFADMGDQWKDGDFGSDVQGLEGIGFDQQVIKVDDKVEEAGVESGPEGGTEVASAPEPPSRLDDTVHYHVERKQESWKFPSRGGDWKLTYLVDNTQLPIRGETGQVEKGCAVFPRKVVMNGGRTLCGSKNNFRDPRKQNHESGRADLGETFKLQLPKFALKALVSKMDGSAEDYHLNHSQHSVTTLKGAYSTTPKSQVSTPRSQLSAHRSISVGLVVGGGFKSNKSGKSSSTPGLGTVAGSKSLSQVKQLQPLSKGSKVVKGSNVAVKRESPGTVKNSSLVDDCELPQLAASLVDDQLIPASNRNVEGSDRTSKPVSVDGLLQFPSPRDRQQQASDSELSKSTNATPLKKLFLSRSVPPKVVLDIKDGHDCVITSCHTVLSAASNNERLDKWPQRKHQDKPVFPALGSSVSPSLSAHSARLQLSVTEKLQAEGLTGEDLPHHAKQLLDESMMQAGTSVHEPPCDGGAQMMELPRSDPPASVLQDTTSVGGDLCRPKRKASSVEDGEASKHNTKSIQRRRLSDNEDGDGDRKPMHPSVVSHTVNSTMPPLVDDNPTQASEVGPLMERDKVKHRDLDHNWASLNPIILRSVFRSLRGDVKTLVNAMVTCKSWLAAGRRCKTELKRADLSSVQGHSLDAVLESLPEFGGGKLRKIILKGCTVSPESLGHLLRACPSISAVEIGSKERLKDLIYSFPQVRWVGDDNGTQIPRERLIRKRESHLKRKSLKVIGLQESSRRDGGESEMHPASDGYTCLVSNVEESSVNESVQDSGITHFSHGPSNGVKHLQLNNGATIVRSNGVNGSAKSVKQENGSSISRLQLKRKGLVASSHRKLEKASYRMSKVVVGGPRAPVDKQFSVKVEYNSKSTSSSLVEGDKTLEKEMGVMLRVMMEADTSKCFQSANNVSTDSKGGTPVSAAKTPDLLMIEKKLKGGAYAGGKGGFKIFKEDVNHVIRTAFRNDKDKLTYSTAEKIFKLAHQQFASLENQISGILPVDPSNQGKLPGTRPFNKASKARVNNHSMLQRRPGKKRKAWDDDGVQKGKFGVAKKVRPGESSSGDVDSDSDSTEHETRRFSKLKKERWWEYEGGSSEDDDETAFMEEDEEETETEASDSDVPSESEGEDGVFEDEYCDTDEEQLGYHDWGARMTKAAMVPPVTRKYVVIEEYRIVADRERVEQKMKVELPKDYQEKIRAAKDKRIDNYSHLDIPEMRDYKPRKKLGEEVMEQEVYGIDPYTHNLLWDTMPSEISGFSDSQRQQFIEEWLLLALNREVKQYTGTGKAPMEFNLESAVRRIAMEAEADQDWALRDFSEQLLTNMRNRPKDKFVGYRKGLGVVCNKDNGLEKDEFVVEFFGEVYPPWRWYEKQDGIRSLQKKDKDTTPEFYNIFYERPKGDAAGYDLLVVDAMHKANFASRLCHSCRPNCEAKITAVNNTYIIGVYTLKPIRRGEELTFDYNSVTEIILKHHGLLDRHRMLLDSCTSTSVTEKELQEMRQAGLGSMLLSGLPIWVLKYAASLVRFMNFEKTHLPAELLKDLELKLKQGVIEGCTEMDAEITTEGVYNQRLQNLAITLDKVRHILSKIYKNPSLAPPPLQKLEKSDLVQWIWKREDSVVHELLQCLGPHLDKDILSQLKLDISKHEPSDSGTQLRQCLLWLRDELRRLPATCKARHDAAADLIHIYAYTKTFFTMENYDVVESTPMTIHPLDLGSSRHSISGPRTWHKTYSKEYVCGQLIGWYKQSVADPGASLAKASRGCLTLPDVSSCYAKSMQHDFRLGYGQKHRAKMIWHMEEKPQHKWPNSKFWSQFWSFKNERCLFGSPMLDSVLENRPLDCQMVEWLRTRKDVFEGPWDEQ